MLSVDLAAGILIDLHGRISHVTSVPANAGSQPWTLSNPGREDGHARRSYIVVGIVASRLHPLERNGVLGDHPLCRALFRRCHVPYLQPRRPTTNAATRCPNTVRPRHSKKATESVQGLRSMPNLPRQVRREAL